MPTQERERTDSDSQLRFTHDVNELHATIDLLDEKLPKDPQLDVTTSLRVSFDEIAWMAELSLGTSVEDRVKHMLSKLIADRRTPAEGAAIMNAIQGLDDLCSALNDGQAKFIAEHSSRIWKDSSAKDDIFTGVEQTRQVLGWFIGSEPITESSELGNLITTIQQRLHQEVN